MGRGRRQRGECETRRKRERDGKQIKRHVKGAAARRQPWEPNLLPRSHESATCPPYIRREAPPLLIQSYSTLLTTRIVSQCLKTLRAFNELFNANFSTLQFCLFVKVKSLHHPRRQCNKMDMYETAVDVEQVQPISRTYQYRKVSISNTIPPKLSPNFTIFVLIFFYKIFFPKQIFQLVPVFTHFLSVLQIFLKI